MFCPICGSELDPNGVCPKCNPSTSKPKAQESKKFFRSPDNRAKSFTAIFSALLVFPASICVAIDLSFSKADGWSGYVVGAILVVWVCAVLPQMRVIPPTATSFVCAATIIGYICFIAGKTGHLTWLYKFALPLFLLTVAFIAVDVAFIGGGQVKGLHVPALLSGEAAIFLMVLEATIDNWTSGTIHLRWSLIVSCGFISMIAVLEAFNYTGKLKSKK